MRGVKTYPIPIVSQQNQRSTVVIPSFLVWNKGAIRSVENEDSFRLTISRVESFWSFTTAGWPPISFRISSVNQVLVLFLYAIPTTGLVSPQRGSARS